MSADVVIVGGGVVGWATALGLRRRGLSVALVHDDSPVGIGRTVALLGDSISFLHSLDLWDHLVPYMMPMEGLHIIDATDSFFSMLPQSFMPQEVGRDSFGYSIALENLLKTFADHGASLERSSAQDFTLYKGAAKDYIKNPKGVTVVLEDGTSIGAHVLVAADGAGSLMRRQAGIDVQTWPYAQQALTMCVSHEADHKKNVIEYHTRSGPLTLLPVQLPLESKPAYPFSSHIVWVVSSESGNTMIHEDRITLARQLEKVVDFVWGPMAIETPVQKIPLRRLAASQLTTSRVFLVGESAHQWSPLGAQGLNSGLSDVAALVEVLDQGYRRGLDLGDLSIEKAYAQARGRDIAIRGEVIHRFNHALLAQPGIGRLFSDGMRGMGGFMLSTFPALRRVLMERTLTSSSRV